ncbi:MAG: 5-(carboxyamino)imidazole ribonucleotide mutase [Oscillospiraceae bacterium]|jgi:5-(carboxyamino)imidazole ribonucleotide mutase|nr:5-(carboxyamino)imidazole ribonucleotide mutase [Oscillospiraceae bacterium]
MKKAAILMGSISDLETVRPAFALLEELGIAYEAHVFSAHRTPRQAAAFARDASANGFGVLIAAAGKAAHLAGALAAQTALPIIGIPIKSSTLDGLDALLSTVQMPQGMPVATVAIDGAYNAAMLAAQILAVENDNLAQKLAAMREAMTKNVLQKDAELQTILARKVTI